jgi:hypothetical protein
MREKMSKIFEYKGNKFNIEVQFDTTIEKKIGGKRFHTITVNDLGESDYYQTYDIEDHDCRKEMIKLQEDIMSVVDGRNIENDSRAILRSLGFR